ncbi:MAG TPA: hypothetical protein VF644_02270 [Pyrinomonadaceae bacterium]
MKLFNSRTNKPKTLEEKVMQNGFFYIEDIVFYAAEKKIKIVFINNPEAQSAKRVLYFLEVEDLSEEILSEDFEKGDIDSLIGLDEYYENNYVKYVVHTEVRELIFRTKQNPIIEDVG